jgi:hypothetical protein
LAWFLNSVKVVSRMPLLSQTGHSPVHRSVHPVAGQSRGSLIGLGQLFIEVHYCPGRTRGSPVCSYGGPV